MTHTTETKEDSKLSELEMARLEAHHANVRAENATVEMLKAKIEMVTVQLQNQIRQLSLAKASADAKSEEAVKVAKTYAAELAEKYGASEPLQYDTRDGTILGSFPDKED